MGLYCGDPFQIWHRVSPTFERQESGWRLLLAVPEQAGQTGEIALSAGEPKEEC